VQCVEALDKLEPEAQRRVLNYLGSRYRSAGPNVASNGHARRNLVVTDEVLATVRDAYAAGGIAAVATAVGRSESYSWKLLRRAKAADDS
jgi:hypothetical protein